MRKLKMLKLIMKKKIRKDTKMKVKIKITTMRTSLKMLMITTTQNNKTSTRKMNSDLTFTKANIKDKLNETMKSKRSVTSNKRRAIVQSEIFNPENDHSNMSTKYDRQMIELTEEKPQKVIKVDNQSIISSNKQASIRENQTKMQIKVDNYNQKIERMETNRKNDNSITQTMTIPAKSSKNKGNNYIDKVTQKRALRLNELLCTPVPTHYHHSLSKENCSKVDRFDQTLQIDDKIDINQYNLRGRFEIDEIIQKRLEKK